MDATFSGVWPPIVTPFVDGKVDYVRAGIAGIIPLGTTGESPTVDEAERERIVERTVVMVDGRVPVVVGVSGTLATRSVVDHPPIATLRQN